MGYRSTAATEYSSIRTIDLANQYGVPVLDMGQLIERIFHNQWIDLCAWDGKVMRPFGEWPFARAFWDSTEDSGYQRIKTLLDGKKRLIELQGVGRKKAEEEVTPLPTLLMSPATAIDLTRLLKPYTSGWVHCRLISAAWVVLKAEKTYH